LIPALKSRLISGTLRSAFALEIRGATTERPPIPIEAIRNDIEFAIPADPSPIFPMYRPTMILSVTPIKTTPNWAITIGKASKKVFFISSW
jgi:hypothetical protein